MSSEPKRLIARAFAAVLRRREVSRARMGVTVAGVLLLVAVGWRLGDLGGAAKQDVVPNVVSLATERPMPKPTRRVTPSPAPTPSSAPTPEPTPPPTPEPTPEPPPSGPPCGGPPFLTWVWRFSTDGPAQEIASRLTGNRGAVIMKTHDGTDWMVKYDPSADAVTGPEQVAALAGLFEGNGVPFHAYAVVKGIDPIAEAQMAASVLAAGARSIFLDLEPWSGYWQGTPEAALAFGAELRRLQPEGKIITAIDPRPWAVAKAPVAEFASFSDALAPLIYWETFNSPGTRDGYTQSGFPPPNGEVTPEFLLDVTAQVLQPYGVPLRPVGQGASDSSQWTRFIDHATAGGTPELSVWRYGVTAPDVWSLLGERTPSGQEYIVQSGDTLFAIAQRWGVDTQRIAWANRLADPNVLSVGQVLCIPTG